MPDKVVDELARIFGAVVVACVVGLLFGSVTIALIICLILLLAWHFLNLIRLHRWLVKGKKYVPPTSSGLWDEVFTGIYRLQQRSRKRNKRIVKLLNRFRESTAALPDGVVVLDQLGNIEWWNDSAEALLGLRYPQDVGQRITNLVRSPDFIAYFSKPAPNERAEFSSPTDEERTLSVRRVSYGNNQELVLIRDITILHRVDQMRKDFVANISHELRTPLTVMRGFLENMQDNLIDDEEQRKRSINLMQQQASRMHRLVEDLMLLSRLENDEREIAQEIVSVPQILSTIREEVELLNTEKRHEINWDVDDNLYIRGNAKQIDSAFLNLIVNAINYTPQSGQIAVRWFEDQEGAHFEVKDNGVGISPHHLPRLTERFYRVDVARSRESGGSGLGLAIVKHIMSRHNGKLLIQSTVGKGSTFKCIFPAETAIRNLDDAGKESSPAA